MSTATLHRPMDHRPASVTVGSRRTVVRSSSSSCGHRHPGAARVSVVPQRTGLRLTHRGRTLLTLTLLLIVSAIAIVGALRATAAPNTPPAGWVEVIVQPGDSLWGLASDTGRADGDPRAVMADIRSVNGLASASLVAGERLWIPGPAA